MVVASSNVRLLNIEQLDAGLAQAQQVVVGGNEISNCLFMSEMVVGLQCFHFESVDFSVRAADPSARAVSLIEPNGRNMVHRQLAAFVQLQLVVVEEHDWVS